ncbi:hypothetical protein L1987_40036 [Smallanthus sonchifolius]|uniref:Uncharacterized protein n=1 Tax=Smallanthus sonchifolius TaxID=185202 RepID=A0ACB9GSH7_9ASTR|nr:hypothetical protein L1987_40036 [Smallanthus sonchifolius]
MWSSRRSPTNVVISAFRLESMVRNNDDYVATNDDCVVVTPVHGGSHHSDDGGDGGLLDGQWNFDLAMGKIIPFPSILNVDVICIKQGKIRRKQLRIFIWKLPKYVMKTNVKKFL